jgi:twitching motility protein PilT
MSGSAKKTVPLLGRLAVQLKLMTPDQLGQALQLHEREPEKPLGELFVELGLVSQPQLAKLLQVQRDVVAKHRAKAAAGKGQAAPAKAAAPRPAPEAKPAPAAPPPELAPAAPPAPAAELELDFAVGTPQPGAAPAAELAAPPPGPAAPAAELAAPPPAPAAPPPAAAPAKAAPVAASATSDDENCESLELELGRGAGDRDRLQQILRAAVEAGASDVHIHAGAPVKLRVNGAMASTGELPLAADEAERLALASLEPAEQEELARAGEIDACLSIEGIGRFRINAYRQQRGFDVVYRSIPAEPPTLESLGLPEELGRFTNYHQGMVLITGPAGCGKSSTMAALVDKINAERDEHILTVEDPIEYVHKPKGCHVNQRHAGRHTGSFARALRAALREDPDVIVIGELRDLETISLAMTAAETGHFVLATLHTANAVRTINRMIGAFPSNRQDQVRTMLSESLRAVISQRLVPTADESRRVAALEILVVNKAISNLVRDEKTVQIRSAIQTGAAQGMRLLEQSLGELVRSGTITSEAAMAIAEDKKLLQG